MGWKDFLNPSVGVVSSLANVGSTMAANAYNLQNAREQRAFEQQQWMMQTAYNHPKAQMERLISAGLNPNLAMGDSGNMSNQPSFTGPSQAIPPQIDPMLLSQIEVNNAQAENLRADADLKKTNVRESESIIDLNNARVAEIEANVQYKRSLYEYQKLQNDAAKITNYFMDYYNANINKLVHEGLYYAYSSDVQRYESDAKFFGNIIGYLEKMYEVTGVFPKLSGGIISEFETRFGTVTRNDGTYIDEWNAWQPYLNKLNALLEKDSIDNAVDGSLLLLNAALSNLYGEEAKLSSVQRRFLSLNVVLQEASNFVKYDEETETYSITVGGKVYSVGKDVMKAIGEVLGFDFAFGKKSTTVSRQSK